jgi:pyrroline-5-carboxylate reductase
MAILACIGAGNMGAALMKGAAKGSSVFFTDSDSEKARSASAALGAGVLASNAEAAAKGDYVFLAVKPQILAQVLAEIAQAAKDRLNAGNPPVFVSMAAGWSIEKIQSVLGAKLPVVRIMPNTPALIGKGMIALAASPQVSAEKSAALVNILEGAGIVDCVDESLMDAVTGLSGSGPAFAYLFIESLAEGGEKAGLPKDKALSYAAQTVLGAAEMVQQTGKQPGELRAMVTSPNGTTVAGLAALEKGDFGAVVNKAVEAAWKRSIELGKN